MHRNFDCSQTAKRSFLEWNYVEDRTHFRPLLQVCFFQQDFNWYLHNWTVASTGKKLFSPRIKLFLLGKTGQPKRNTSIWNFRWFTFLRTYRLDAFSQKLTQALKCFEAGFDRNTFGLNHCHKVMVVRNFNEVLAKLIWLDIRTHIWSLLQASYHAARST